METYTMVFCYKQSHALPPHLAALGTHASGDDFAWHTVVDVSEANALSFIAGFTGYYRQSGRTFTCEMN